MTDSPLPFPYAITGVATQLGKVIPIDDWAELARLPNRKWPQHHLHGQDLEHILGVHAKSFDPDLFANLDPIVHTANAALESARLSPADLDALIVATGSSYQNKLDQDAFTIARRIGLPDTVPPIQMGTGCAGIARAAAHAARSTYRHVLIVTYFIPSVSMFDSNGQLLPVYRTSVDAPLITWAAPATFSDAAAAILISRSDTCGGIVFYSRDTTAFGDEPGLTDPLVHYLDTIPTDHPTNHPAGQRTGRYALNPPEIRHYYPRAMMLNHHTLSAADPHYPTQVRRIYTHQAGPELVHDFVHTAGLPLDKVPSNAADIGNTVSASTLLLLHDDIRHHQVTNGDRICINVVGSGPERGALTTTIQLPEAHGHAGRL
ncbi:3-oxoacyl-[acyl-carrier-protein] synthase III C-terminal domain-containing protein [Dactylosporangium sp. NPDC049525]|uniref:3-oxoacyl-[acyl-carrier-protein] synthase III C-terminal domain-containing protein n=1 Tax=Dactylosporangium sp. NPDC049525 TaxID=3154730 RepID=UPI00341FE050